MRHPNIGYLCGSKPEDVTAQTVFNKKLVILMQLGNVLELENDEPTIEDVNEILKAKSRFHSI
jgi:hypothetical protein